MAQNGNDFNAIRISLASPEQIKTWSYGEITKPETINYRTLRPEKDGLFCERIFGPTKDWECYCGRYKKIRYRGVICDRCGVEVARAKVRRERMGHIELAAPVAHIWFSKGTPSRMGLMLDLSPRNLDRVLYFAQYLVTTVDEDMRTLELDRLSRELDEAIEEFDTTAEEQLGPARAQLAELQAALEEAKSQREAAARADEESLRARLTDLEGDEESAAEIEELSQVLEQAEQRIEAEKAELDSEHAPAIEEAAAHLADLEQHVAQRRDVLEDDLVRELEDLEGISVGQLLTESRYRELRSKFSTVFRAGMGAEAVRERLMSIDLDAERDRLQAELTDKSGQKRKKAIKRLRVVEAFRKSENKPEWMVLTTLPVLPPELRPMVQLDGGRFATSDLNDLYRRVINRNNRLKRLMDLMAPEIIVRNEKRMLQEAVDALVDNGRRGRPVAGSHNHRLKSLSDLLRGKQGRFRQNLLGKRVDYSGRSVIIAGPDLSLNECGLPRRMALELFKPFVMHELVMKGYAHNIKSAKRMADRATPEVWDILETVVIDRPVLLNRAPTLHRLGIQAFMPRLIEGSAIQVHPLVCAAFNADFDGDQMAVHVPLSREAVLEANRMMMSIYNMLSPSSGQPIVAPTLDMVLGCYYMTMMDEDPDGRVPSFASFEDAKLAYQMDEARLPDERERIVKLRQPIKVRARNENGETEDLTTTVGRIIFNDQLPAEVGFQNKEMDRSALQDVTADCFRRLGNEATVGVLDGIKALGFHYATKAGITVAINDIEVPAEKTQILGDAEAKVEMLDEQFMDGLITQEERYENAVKVWTDANDKLTSIIQRRLDRRMGNSNDIDFMEAQGVVEDYGSMVAQDNNVKDSSGIYLMAQSGAKGNIAQIKQMAGMRGLMSDPKGFIRERPVKANFREGLSVLEYFLSTHGARKGLADTALRTADSGYLTRRLIDVSQEIIVMSEDCETEGGVWVADDSGDSQLPQFVDRVRSRYLAAPAAHPETGEILMDRNEVVDEETVERLREAGVTEIMVRSPLRCQAERGVCRMCYGLSLATMQPVMLGEAVGIIAAQSIGEPGTQLTMRTFHTGGIAGVDITSGLPRVVELFEARVPKGEAVLSEIEGEIDVIEEPGSRTIRVSSIQPYSDEYELPEGYELRVNDGDPVSIGATLAAPVPGDEGESEDDALALPAENLIARESGIVNIGEGSLTIAGVDEDIREYTIPAAARIIVSSGDTVQAGDPLTSGNLSPQRILAILGREDVERYLTDEVQRVYVNQGVAIHDKHIEVIISQMLRKVRIDAPGDTELLPGEYMDRQQFRETMDGVLAEGGEPATASPVLLGITRASLNVESFLAMASFQETTRVLTESAINGEIDYLRGLKENVIIGRLIPARLDNTEEGRELLGIDDEELVPPEPIGMLAQFPGDDPSPFGPFDLHDSYEEAASPADD